MADVDVSVLTPVLNEARHLRAAVARMVAQTHPGPVEFLFIDGGSSDGSRELLAELAAHDPRIRILDNPHRRTPQALNIGLRAARGEYVARMDAHTLYPADYLARGVERLGRGDVAHVSGPQIAEGDGPWSRRVAIALGTPLGFGGAKFRRATGETDVDSGFTGVWRRETVVEHGGWDEGWPVNQDAELAARIRAGGGRLVCVPEMGARYVPRDSLRALARQYWRYGQYRAKTCGRYPKSMRRSHLLPPVVTVVVAGSLAPARAAAPFRVATAAYALVLAGESIRIGLRSSSARRAAWLPAVFAAMHLAWGTGFLVGSARFGIPATAIRSALNPR